MNTTLLFSAQSNDKSHTSYSLNFGLSILVFRLPGGFQMYKPVHCSEAPQYGGYQQLPEQLGVEAAPTQGNP